MKSFIKVWLSIGLIAIVFGVGILIIAVGSGVGRRDYETFSLNESYEGVQEIHAEIGYGKVKIVEGNQFSINAKNLINEEMESYVIDGVWTIRETNDYSSNIFGINISLGQLVNWKEDYQPEITITIPKNFVAENFELYVGAGDVEAEAINALEGTFKVDAGRFTIDQISISGESQYTVGAGEMVLQQMEVNNITLDCGVGNVQVEGTIKGENEIECGMGSVNLHLSGDESDYSYYISSGLGEVSVDNRNYHNITNEIINNNDTDNNFTLDCGIGNISVEFN